MSAEGNTLTLETTKGPVVIETYEDFLCPNCERFEQRYGPDLTTALQLVRKTYAPNWPSMISFITGPSRTGDIERILVLGAHGPKKLTVFLVP